MTINKNPDDALRKALSGAFLRRSLTVSIIIGTLLNVINQGDALIAGSGINWLKMGLTYLVPFCVSTYGTYSAIRGAG